MDTGKRILIVIGNAGAGHLSCANTTKHAILEKYPHANVEIFDLFTLSKSTSMYNTLYYIVSRSAIVEGVYNFLYKMIDRYKWYANFSEILIVTPLRKSAKKFLDEYKPDIVICNNALTVTVIDDYCEKYGKSFKYYLTVPDLVTVSRWWASREADIVFCPTEESVKKVKSFNDGVNTLCCYYPLREVVPSSRDDLRKKKVQLFSDIGFDVNSPTILVTGCGFATGSIVSRMYTFIRNSGYQFIILAGNDHILKRVLDLKFKDNSNVFVSGFTKRIIDFMEASDIVVSKPGPATLLEIERLNKKAIFTKAIGYQEYGNVDYLKKNPNFVYIGKRYDQIPDDVKKLLQREVVPYKSSIKDINKIVERIS